MDINALIDELKRDEGLRLRVYRDSVGIETIGIGRNLRDRGITEGEAFMLCRNDIESVKMDLDKSLPWWRQLDEVRQRALANMCFNLGIHGLLGFRNTLAMIQAGKFTEAAANMLESKWAQQVGPRAFRLSKMLATGAALCLLLLACTSQVKQQAQVDISQQATSHRTEDSHEVDNEDVAVEVKGDFQQEPTTLVGDTKVTTYAPDGGVAKTVERHFTKTTGAVKKTEDKTAKTNSEVHKDIKVAEEGMEGITMSGKSSFEKKTDIGPGWHFYLYITLVGLGALAAAYLFLKMYLKVSWL